MRASMSPLHSPGKTVPRLVQDIRHYDPTYPPANGRNLLSEVPPVFADGYRGLAEYISPNACDHQYVTKANRSALKKEGPSNLFAVCMKCRRHLQVTVDSCYTIGQNDQNSADHAHHLVCKGGRQIGTSTPEEVTSKGQRVEVFRYDCSYLTCPTRVFVSIASPILYEHLIQLLTDPELLRKRTEDAVAAHPNCLDGTGPPLVTDVLMNLRTYINNALLGGQRNKRISSVNRKFVSCFGVEGQASKDLLRFLEFNYYEEEGFWEPPHLEALTDPEYRSALETFLSDVSFELLALIEQRPPSERKDRPLGQHEDFAYDDILDMLESRDYPKAARLDEFQMPNTPCYDDLGVVEDMASQSIVEAFNRQVSVDPARTALYLKSLKTIGCLRGGQDSQDGTIIDYAVQGAYSEGKFTDDDAIAAYEYFGWRRDDKYLTDDAIIGKFHAFLKDTTNENETRRQLWRIGEIRKSDRIKCAAEDRVSTVEQAMVFLGVEPSTADDFVIAMYTTKISDAPFSEDLAKRAVELIALHRDSALLKRFLQTGDTTSDEMDVAEAYRLLQIPDRTADEGSIIAAYTICVDEAPHQADIYHRALKTIANECNSHLLSEMISGSTLQSDGGLSDWPVGLQNIGNTCYLNSLLQFYFSVRPFRDMVLEFENIKMELSGETLSKKQVGSRRILPKEIERSQLFVRELRGLFHDMTTSPQSFVTPSQELARLTLISPANEAAIRRRSTLPHSRSLGLGEISGMPVIGPLGPPHIATVGEPSTKSESVEPVIQESLFQGVINCEPDGEAAALDATSAANFSTMDANTENHGDELLSDIAMKDPSDDQTHEAAAVAGPPPVPPRPVHEADRERQLREEVELGAQQDVTEAINNVLFQSQCAIKPTAISQDGEQLDQVKDLFYGRSKSYISAEGEVRSKEEWWCDIKIDVASGTRDIYAAMDGAFDAQKITVGNSVAEQFSAISELPPILQIQIQRVQFDPVKKSSFKSTHHLDLKEVIYLDRYMDTSRSDFVDRRRQNWKLKNTLKQLEARQRELRRTESGNADAQDIVQLFSDAKGVLSDLDDMKEDPEVADDRIDVDHELLSGVDKLLEVSRSELSAIEQELQVTKSAMDHQFDDPEYKNLPYQLYAVFVHRGTVNFGHYWIYIFDFKKNVWRKYNDTYVTEVHDTAEIFQGRDELNPPTPYFVVYVNDQMKERLTEPVCREIIKGQAALEDGLFSKWGATAPVDTTEEDIPGHAADVDMSPPSYGESWGGDDSPGMHIPPPSPSPSRIMEYKKDDNMDGR